MSSPTARSMPILRDELGYDGDVVERWIPAAKGGFRKDWLGLADAVLIADDHTLFVQFCAMNDLTEHVEKCLGNPKLDRLLGSPSRAFQIWAWGKRRREGRDRWVCRRLRATVENGELVFIELADGGAPAVSPETEPTQEGVRGESLGTLMDPT